MDEQPPKDKGYKFKLSEKLALLVGGGLAIINGTAITNSEVIVPTRLAETTIVSSAPRSGGFPAKLILRQWNGGLKMIAQHDSHTSHTSHSSHSSHDSHSSHNSHTSHSSHSSHSSHASHTSGGFV
jgi:hypothetical protein